MEDAKPSSSQARVPQLLEQIIELAGPRATAAAGQFANKLAQLGIIHTRPEQVPVPAPTSERAPLDPQAQPLLHKRNLPLHKRSHPKTSHTPTSTHARTATTRACKNKRKVKSGPMDTRKTTQTTPTPPPPPPCCSLPNRQPTQHQRQNQHHYQSLHHQSLSPTPRQRTRWRMPNPLPHRREFNNYWSRL